MARPKVKLLNGYKGRASRPDSMRAMAARALPALEEQREQIERIDSWATGDQLELADPTKFGAPKEGWPYHPKQRGAIANEFTDTATKAITPIGRLIVNSLAQTIHIESARIAGQKEGDRLDCFDVLYHQNGWKRKQIPVTRATISHGLAFVKTLPGISPLDGSRSAHVSARSGKRMWADYQDPWDEWPVYGFEVLDWPGQDAQGRDTTGSALITDDEGEWFLTFKGTGYEVTDWSFVGPVDLHGLGVTPIVRHTNSIDLDGRVRGEIEPVIPMLRRIDQDVYDRLIVQRFGAWKIRYIAGLAQPTTDAERRAQELMLSSSDILVAGDADTKFGTLDETPTKGYIEATDADLRMLSAVVQLPPHHLLGLSSNLQAEALAASEAGLQRKSQDYRISDAGSVEQTLRLIATIRGRNDEARAASIETRYRDDESRSFNQTAQALSYLARDLKIPVEMLWGKIPDWTDDDTTRAKELILSGALDEFFARAAEATGQDGEPQTNSAEGSAGASAPERAEQ